MAECRAARNIPQRPLQKCGRGWRHSRSGNPWRNAALRATYRNSHCQSAGEAGATPNNKPPWRNAALRATYRTANPNDLK
jgi:hypothetical protein